MWLVVHERTRSELESLFPLDRDRIVFVPDTKAHLLVWRLSQLLPDRISSFTAGFLMRFMTQIAQRREIRRLLREQGISVVHQPIPVSPKEPSLIFGMSVPVIIGPMNGGMDYPPGFRKLQGATERLALAIGRRLADFMNWLMPGKRKASMLLVANERTRAALPRWVCSHIVNLVENGVDLALWSQPPTAANERTTQGVRFVFMGRLVALKAVDLLLIAFKQASCANRGRVFVYHRRRRTSSANLEQMAGRLGILGNGRRSTRQGEFFSAGWRSRGLLLVCSLNPTPWCCRACTSAAAPSCWKRWRWRCRSLPQHGADRSTISIPPVEFSWNPPPRRHS